MSPLFKDRRVLWMPFELDARKAASSRAHCCEAMNAALTFTCEQHADPFECADSLVVYNEPFDEYGLAVHDGGASYVLIRHCPWCGGTLPEGRRDDWFDATENLPEPLPEKYFGAAWREK